jgi:hypothetical protein
METGEYVITRKYRNERLYLSLSGWVDLIEGFLNHEIRFFISPADAQNYAHAISRKQGISCTVEEVR